MGREIRRVIPNWEHPRQTCLHSPWAGGCEEAKRSGRMCYKPLKNGFKADLAEFVQMLHEKGAREATDYWGGAPYSEDYADADWTEEPTWYQVYETVSEGTPVTPAFSTPEELVDYLVKNGDYWDQYRGDGGWSRENAEAFVSRGSAFSFIVENSGGGLQIRAPRDGVPV